MIKSDRWIRRMAQSTGMIEPFEPEQVREVDGRRIVSYGTSSYGYDIRCRREFKIFTNINSTIVDPKAFDARLVRRLRRRRLHHPAQLVRARAHRRVLPDTAQRADHLPRQVDLRALRHHRQRDPVRARVGGPRDARILEHDAAARQDLRQRGHRPGRSSSSPTRFAKPRTRIAAASTRGSTGSRCPRSDVGARCRVWRRRNGSAAPGARGIATIRESADNSRLSRLPAALRPAIGEPATLTARQARP